MSRVEQTHVAAERYKALMRFDDFLDHLVKDQHLSYREIARKSGVSHTTIYRLRTEERDPFLSTAMAIVDAFLR